MKVSKTEIVKFLKGINLKGIVDEVVFEEDGTVTVGYDKQLIIAASTEMRLSEGQRVGVTNLSLLLKIIESLETEDNTVNIAVEGTNMVIAARSGRYDFRLASVDVIESLKKDRENVFKLLEETAVKVEVPFLKIANLKKAISTLGADRITIDVNKESKIASAVVYDDKTRSTATIELGEADGDFKNTYNADILVRVMDMVEDDTVVVCVTMDKPLFFDLKKAGFCYMLSPWKKVSAPVEK
jgi:ATP-dependent Lon protease